MSFAEYSCLLTVSILSLFIFSYIYFFNIFQGQSLTKNRLKPFITLFTTGQVFKWLSAVKVFSRPFCAECITAEENNYK